MTHDDRANRYVGPPRVAADGAVYVWCPNPPDGTRCKSETCIKTQKCQKGVPMPHAKEATHPKVCMAEQPDKAETPIVDAVAAECRKALGIGVAIGNAHGMGLIIGKCVENLLDVACDLELKLAAAEQRLAIHALAMNTGGIEELHARAEQAEQRAEELKHDIERHVEIASTEAARAEEMRRERDACVEKRNQTREAWFTDAKPHIDAMRARLRAVEAALAELVYLEDDLSPRIQKGATMMACIDAQHEYWRRAPLAWESARQALSTPQEEKKS